jgi:hypothetical protein
MHSSYDSAIFGGFGGNGIALLYFFKSVTNGAWDKSMY